MSGATDRPARRCRGQRGAGMVTGLVLMFAFTTGGVVWLARDVDRAISHRAAAQSVAFQAARSGAQQLDVVAIRSGTEPPIPVDPTAAHSAAISTAEVALQAYGLAGSVTGVTIDRDRVTVEIEVRDAGRTVTGRGSARASEEP